MASNEEYLDNLLKTIEDPGKEKQADKVEKPEETVPWEGQEQADEDVDALVSSILNENVSEENKILSPEEIEAMFDAAEKVAKPEENNTNSFADLGDISEEEISKLIESSTKVDDSVVEENLNALLNDIDEDQNINAINELLDKSDNYEAVSEEIGKEVTEEEQEPSEIVEPEKTKKGKKERKKLFGKKKSKKEAGDESEEPTMEESVVEEPISEETVIEEPAINESEQTSTDAEVMISEEEAQKIIPEKKKGFFAKILDYITEEDEEEDEKSKEKEKNATQGNESMVPSDENQAILDDLDKEDNKKKGKKKGKKKDDSGDSDEVDGEDSDKKKAKKEKEKKPKKEKKAKPEIDINAKPEPKLSKKKVRGIFILCFSFLIVILICCYYLPQVIGVSSARRAYYQGDYEECYKVMYGKNLSESDKLIFKRSQVMLQVDRKMNAYNDYMAMGDELHAIDVLFQGVAQHPMLHESAAKYGLENEEQAAYQAILDVLSSTYGLLEEQVLEINGYKEDAIYTLRLKAIADGTEFVMPDFSTGETIENSEPVMEDVLDAEEELEIIDFAE